MPQMADLEIAESAVGVEGMNDECRPGPEEEELIVMQMIADGYKDGTIARRLGISVVTVRRRARRFRERIGARSRSQAVALAASCGWLQVRNHPDTDSFDPPSAGD